MIASDRLFAKCTIEPPVFMQIYEISDFFAKAAKTAHFTLNISRKKFPYYEGINIASKKCTSGILQIYATFTNF